MVRYLRDNLYQPPSLQLWDPAIPDLRGRRSRYPSWVPPTGNTNPFGSPPPQPPQQLPDFDLWNQPTKPDPNDTPRISPVLPTWPLPLPSPPGGKSPFADPPPIPPPQKRPPHEVDPSEKNPYNDPDFDPNFLVTKNLSGQTGDEPVGGLLGMLLRGLMQQGQVQQGDDSVSIPNDAPEYSPDSHGSPQGGLLGRLLALQDEQARKGLDSNQQDASRQALPERRLGRRTYRV
jgi:hypothetical protein